MKNFLLYLCFCCAWGCLAQNKSDYDLDKPGLAKTFGTPVIRLYTNQLLVNDKTECSVISGGYYTIGTTNGLSTSRLDDQCGVSFGHPYALTSYPLIALDGSWQKPDQYFNAETLSPVLDGDTLRIAAASDVYQFILKMTALNNGEKIQITVGLKNLDVQSHRIGLGLVFDPALGLWGDGQVILDGQSVHEDKVIESAVPAEISINERYNNSHGMKVKCLTAPEPFQLVIANWRDIINHPGPGLNSQLHTIYDLVLKWLWPELDLAPQTDYQISTTFELLQPDFSSSVFMRWDLPGFFSTENGILFPRDFKTWLQLSNVNAGALSNVHVNLQVPEQISNDSTFTDISIATNQDFYQVIPLDPHEVYEPVVVPVSVSCYQGNTLVDELIRPVYIPAVALTDTGLTVTIDSVKIGQDGKTNIIFNAEVSATKQKVLNLKKDNVFLYENDARIRDLTIDKYYSKGSKLVDVVFVLDCSGSMDDDIANVRNNLNEFAGSLKSNGYDYQIGVVTFSTTVDKVWDFTKDIEKIKQNLAGIVTWGGEEDSPAALYRASQLSFRTGSKRTSIWITDENYSQALYTKQQIVDRMLAMDITVNGIGLAELQTDWFNPIVLPTGGSFYLISGNFRDILLDISRMKGQSQYLAAFSSPAVFSSRHVVLELHYAGLGGSAAADYTIPVAAGLSRPVVCYPNPFNSITRISIQNREGHPGELIIYNILGERIRHFTLQANRAHEDILWNTQDESGVPVSSGVYFVELSLRDSWGCVTRHCTRLLYLK